MLFRSVSSYVSTLAASAGHNVPNSSSFFFVFFNVLQPNSPKIVMDYWTGWYDVWGDLHHVLPPEGREALYC